MYSVATVQKVATSVIMIECGDGSYANYLADQWPKLPNWCGLLPTHGPVEVHGQKVVIAMACGGKFKPEDIPKRNVSGVKSFPNTGDFHIADNGSCQITATDIAAHPGQSCHPLRRKKLTTNNATVPAYNSRRDSHIAAAYTLLVI